MKKVLGLSISYVMLTLATGALAAPFTAGNLVIYRVGDGSGTLTNIGDRVFLDEYTTNGVFVQSIAMPTNWFGAYAPLLASGSATAEGLISLSADGRFILLTGYAGTLGLPNASPLPGLSATTVPRVIGLVDGFGQIDTTTVQTNILASGDGIRSAASTDGTNLWFSGSSGGIRYAQRGSTTATQLGTSVVNTRQVNIFSNQLYGSAMSGAFRLFTAGPGLPTTSGQVYTNLPGFQTSSGSPHAFVFFKLSAGAEPFDTLYVADDLGGAVYKWSLVGGTWVSNGFVQATLARGVTGKLEISGSTTNVHLFITGSGSLTDGALWGFTDTTGFNANPGGGFANVLALAGVNKNFRGIAFAPVGGEPFPSGPGRISVGPILGFFSSGLTGCTFAATQDYSIANPGTNSVSWAATNDVNWVTLSPASGVLAPGDSTNVTASFNANALSLPVGTNTATITFTNTTSELGSTTRLVRLLVGGDSLTPATGLSSSGQPGGPFSPLSQVYTLSSAGSPIDWTASKSATWLDLSATTGSLAACTSTNITVSINTNANSLAAGFYSDTVTFSNATAGTLIGTRTVNLQVGSVYFCDDFSTYSPGNLVGQQGWMQHGTASSLPVQISGGQLVLPAGQTTDNQDIFKNFTPTISNTVFFGMTITVSNVPVGPISYITALCTSNNGTVNVGGSFANYRLNVTNNASGFIAFGARTTGLGATPFINGPFTLTTGTQYRVIVQTDPLGSNTTVYVNPTSDDLGSQTPYLVAAPTGTLGPGQPGPTVGSILISQFASATVANPGVAIGRICISTNYADVYNGITPGPPPLPPFETWQFQYFGSTNCALCGGSADFDGDGMINTNEFLAGFNPTNSAAYLHIINVQREGDNIRVTYRGADGNSTTTPPVLSRTNILEFTAGTAGGSYSNNFTSAGLTNILSGGTGLGVVTNMVDIGGATNVPSRFYRIRVLTP